MSTLGKDGEEPETTIDTVRGGEGDRNPDFTGLFSRACFSFRCLWACFPSPHWSTREEAKSPESREVKDSESLRL